MGSNEKLPMDKKIKTLRKLGISEAGIRNVERLAALPHFFSHRINIGTDDEEVIPYDGHGVLNNYSQFDGTPINPHAPSREECRKRANNRTYRLAAEKRYEDYCSHMGEGTHRYKGEE